MNTPSELLLAQITATLEPPSELWRQTARVHLDALTKPIGSLGRLEDLAAQIVAIRQDHFAEPPSKAVFVFAADHGITAEGVSAYPREVTFQMVLNFLNQGAAINVLAGLQHAELAVIDVGVDADFADLPGLVHRKVSRGSRNMLNEPAMSDNHLAQAIAAGAEIAAEAAAAGKTFVAVGEMGIGNTTAASVITCALTGASPALGTGRGTGVSGEVHAHKTAVVGAVLRRHFGVSADASPLHILRCAGGLEIAAMVGAILSAAAHRLVVILDGFICTAAAALAVALAPAARGYLIAGHQSEEPGHKLLLDHLHLNPVLTLNLRLGEGTGAVLAMPILEAAIALYTSTATFSSAGVSGAS